MKTAFFRCDDGSFGGHALDGDDLDRRFWVDVLVDGVPLRTLRADVYDESLREAGHGDGCYGFAFVLGPHESAPDAVVEVRLTNLGDAVGHALALAPTGGAKGSGAAVRAGRVRWLGGLRLDGEIELERDRKPAGEYRIRAQVDGEFVAEVRPHRWSEVRDAAGEPRPISMFDLHLPMRFADGRLHRVRVTTHDGEELAGSPVPIIAFHDGLGAFLAGTPEAETEQPRIRQFDRTVPMSIPFAEYPQWRERFPPPQAESDEDAKMLVLVIGAVEADATMESLDAQTHQDWVAASLPEHRTPAGFDPELVADILTGDAPERDIVVIALAGTVFAPGALARLAGALRQHPDAIAAYPDIEIDRGDEPWPLFFPAFDYERMLEQGYCANLFAARREPVLAALAGGAASIYRLFNALIDEPSRMAGIVHLPYPAATLPQAAFAESSGELAQATHAHLAVRGVAAEIEPLAGALFPAVRVQRKTERERVSIVIPTRDRAELLKPCIDSILAADMSPVAQIIVVDNGSTDAATLDYLSEIDGRTAKVLRIPGAFNYPALNNQAIEAAWSEHVCLLNNDIEVLTKDWLVEMQARLADPSVGAVGALLVWPNGVVQHGGTVIGPQFAATHAFTDLDADAAGYGDLLKVAHECSAVTAACMLTRRSDYLAVGGLDAGSFPVNFNDVDYCLKLRARGQRIVFTPHARLIHHESASRGSDATPDRAERHRRELRLLRARWGEALLDDPYYSPGLALDPVPFGALAWPLRACGPRVPTRPVPVDIPPGF